MKLVDLVARIPKQLSFHFYDFSTILFRIYKFTSLNLGFSFQLLHLGPWTLNRNCRMAPGRMGMEQRRGASPIPSAGDRRRRGAGGGKGGGDRGGPLDACGWGWGGRRRAGHGALLQAAAAEPVRLGMATGTKYPRTRGYQTRRAWIRV